MDKHTFLFAGRSGSGKGTQVKLLLDVMKEKYLNDNLFQYYSGDGFRKLIAGDGYTSDLAREVNTKGGLQPNFLAVWLWATAFVENLKGDEHIVTDGFPRARVEAEALDSALKFFKREKPTMIHINVSKDASRERLLARKREDDTEESVERRISWYETEVVPAVNFFKDNPDYNFIDINGEQSIEDVHKEIVTKLNLD